MRNSKKWLSALLASALILTNASVPVYATGITESAIETEDIKKTENADKSETQMQELQIAGVEDDLKEESVFMEGGLIWYVILEDGTVEITRWGVYSSPLYCIPSYIDGKRVTSIGNWAFSYDDFLGSIVIPEGITNIGDGAFEGCSNLHTITIPESVTSIGDGAFAFCNKLETIAIPKNVINIGDGAFEYCGSLIEISVSDSNQYYTAQDGVLYNKDKTELLAWPGGKENASIPEGVTSIGDRAFLQCYRLEKITIPEGVTSIGKEAFWGCDDLTEILIPGSVASIGDGAFGNCESLNEILVSDSNQNYTTQSGVLYNKDKTELLACPGGKEDVSIPEGVTSIRDRAFYECNGLTEITIPEGVASIGKEAFSGCDGLTKITIPSSVTSIGASAFYNCNSLTEITIPEGVTNIGASTFYDCNSLTEITIPEGVMRIGEEAFKSCDGLTKITIPSSVTSIGKEAFYNCNSLTEITIPSSVTSIGKEAFYNCNSLTEITIPSSVTSIGVRPFGECFNLVEIIVDENNSNYASLDGILYNKEKTEILCCSPGKTSVVIPSSVTSIGDSAFYSCVGLTEITIPSSVTSIGDSAFRSCEGLTEITIPSSVTSIGDSAFAFCVGLTKVTILEGVTSIGKYPFTYCDNLTIYGYQGSYAQTYAKENDIPFISIGTDPSHTHTYTSEVTTTATCEKDGVRTYTCSCDDTYTETIYKISTVELSNMIYTYDGTAKKPTVTVKDSKGKTLNEKTDYTLTYSDGCTNPGTYTVKVLFKGDYSGEKTLTYD